jgi:hypothetical protein
LTTMTQPTTAATMADAVATRLATMVPMGH